jgi:hypothetical protein
MTVDETFLNKAPYLGYAFTSGLVTFGSVYLWDQLVHSQDGHLNTGTTERHQIGTGLQVDVEPREPPRGGPLPPHTNAGERKAGRFALRWGFSHLLLLRNEEFLFSVRL